MDKSNNTTHKNKNPFVLVAITVVLIAILMGLAIASAELTMQDKEALANEYYKQYEAGDTNLSYQEWEIIALEEINKLDQEQYELSLEPIDYSDYVIIVIGIILLIGIGLYFWVSFRNWSGGGGKI